MTTIRDKMDHCLQDSFMSPSELRGFSRNLDESTDWKPFALPLKNRCHRSATGPAALLTIRKVMSVPGSSSARGRSPFYLNAAALTDITFLRCNICAQSSESWPPIGRSDMAWAGIPQEVLRLRMPIRTERVFGTTFALEYLALDRDLL
jgi:hypothetical protein